jgi:hypothetical protein
MTPPRRSLLDRPAFALLWVALGVLVALGAAWSVALHENHHEDLWIYSSGAAVGWGGQSPYETARIRERVARQFPPEADPGHKTLVENCGFFLAPQAMLAFAPALPFPWTVAKALWCAGTVAFAAFAGWMLLPAFGNANAPVWLCGLAAFALLCNPMALFALVVGQTSLLFASCVVAGQWLYRSGWAAAGNFVWALAFFKPHLALPLLLLAWAMDGWRRMIGVGTWVLVLNVAAGIATTGQPLILIDYVRSLDEGHKAVEFNRIATNPHIGSWNRLLAAAGGPVRELGATGTILGYAAWFGACALRASLRRTRPDTAWMLAAVAVGIPLCCQTLPYELPILILILPWVVERLRGGSIPVAGLAVLSAAAALLLGGEGSTIDRFARAVGSPVFTRLMESHQSFFVALCAGLVLLFPSPSK